MAQARFEPRRNAFYEVRSLPSVKEEIDGLARRGASAAGEGFEWSSRQGIKRPQGRWRAIIYPATFSARRRNANQNVLVNLFGRIR